MENIKLNLTKNLNLSLDKIQQSKYIKRGEIQNGVSTKEIKDLLKGDKK